MHKVVIKLKDGTKIEVKGDAPVDFGTVIRQDFSIFIAGKTRWLIPQSEMVYIEETEL